MRSEHKNYILISSDEPISFDLWPEHKKCHIECKGDISLHYPRDCHVKIGASNTNDEENTKG